MIKTYHVHKKEVTVLSLEIKYALKLTEEYIASASDIEATCNIESAMEQFKWAFAQIHNAQNCQFSDLIPEEEEFVRDTLRKYITQHCIKLAGNEVKNIKEIEEPTLYRLGKMSKSDFTRMLRRIYQEKNYYHPRNIGELPSSHQEIFVKVHDAFMIKYGHSELAILATN